MTDPGAARFSGFSELYDDVRPVPPAELAELLLSYRDGRVERVVDLGSGTGLSTRWAAEWCDDAIGVEPSDDMRTVADARATPGVTSRRGWSHDTGLPSGCADVVLAVQALHWMEPEPTFGEVGRLLRPGGVFAAIDCDWPPVTGDAVCEQAWDECRARLRVFEARLAAGVSGPELAEPVAPDDPALMGHSGADAHRDRTLSEQVRSWSKAGHLDRMSAAGVFAWCREIAMASATSGDAGRFVGLLRSQGDYQTLRRHGLDDEVLGVAAFAALVDARLGPEPRPWTFVYRARLGFASPR